MVPFGGRRAQHRCDAPATLNVTRTKNDRNPFLPRHRHHHRRQHHRRAVALSAVVKDPDGGGSGAADDEQRGEDGDEVMEKEKDEVEEDTAGDIEIPEKPQHIRKVDGFLQGTAAEDLRAVFDGHHDDPKRVHEYRFVWDYWHVPDQYTLLRTPAADYFPKEQYDQLVRGAKGRKDRGRTHAHSRHRARFWTTQSYHYHSVNHPPRTPPRQLIKLSTWYTACTFCFVFVSPRPLTPRRTLC